jgi:hypothetical protein
VRPTPPFGAEHGDPLARASWDGRGCWLTVARQVNPQLALEQALMRIADGLQQGGAVAK